VTTTSDDCVHLSLADVREIHQAVIEEFGGAAGIRDEALLESAVAAPQASAFGQSPFADLVEIAAAHLFYLSVITRLPTAASESEWCRLSCSFF
jgi:prophage maintenance system killer protein